MAIIDDTTKTDIFEDTANKDANKNATITDSPVTGAVTPTDFTAI